MNPTRFYPFLYVISLNDCKEVLFKNPGYLDHWVYPNINQFYTFIQSIMKVGYVQKIFILLIIGVYNLIN